MNRLNLVLLLVLLGFAAATVTSQHQARKLYMALQEEEQRSAAISEEWDKLQLEQSTWAMPARVEQVARDYLHMQVPETRDIRVVFVGGDAP